MSPRVSVVIPTYNRVADLRRALDSVRRQTVKDWEAVVVDNRSSDGTRQMVESLQDARIRFIEVDNGGVVGVSRNVGWRAAQGEFIALLDSDDWWKPEKLQRSLDELARGADLVYHDLYLVYRNNQKLFWGRARTRPLRAPIHADLLEVGNAVTNSSVVVRRSLFEKVGGISEDRALIAFEDYDTWLRMAQVSDRFVRIETPLGYYWKGGANLSTPERTIRNLDHFRSVHFASSADVEGKLPAWIEYAYGRAYYHLGSPDLSRVHMRRALGGRLILSKYFKAWLTLLAMTGRRASGGRT